MPSWLRSYSVAAVPKASIMACSDNRDLTEVTAGEGEDSVVGLAGDNWLIRAGDTALGAIFVGVLITYSPPARPAPNNKDNNATADICFLFMPVLFEKLGRKNQ